MARPTAALDPWGNTNVWERHVRDMVKRYVKHAGATLWPVEIRLVDPITGAAHGLDTDFLEKVEKYLSVPRHEALRVAKTHAAPELTYADLRLACRNVLEDSIAPGPKGRRFLNNDVPPVYAEAA